MSPLDATRFAHLTQRLLADDDAQATLQRVVDLAVKTIDSCDYAGVSIRHGRSELDTPAWTDEIAIRSDQLQYELGEGPCVDAVWVDDLYVVDDLRSETRWPHWAPAAVDLGLRSVLSIRLSTEATVVGGLNLYARDVAAYDEDDVLTAHVYALHASSAIRQTQQSDGLRVALRTRHLIGMAQGVLIARLGLDEEQAFQFLRRLSQDHNVKLRDVATTVVAHRGSLAELAWSVPTAP